MSLGFSSVLVGLDVGGVTGWVVRGACFCGLLGAGEVVARGLAGEPGAFSGFSPPQLDFDPWVVVDPDDWWG